MRAAIVALILAGCSPEAAPETLTAWHAPVAWTPNELQGPVLRILAEKGLDPMVIGDRGSRFWVPYERHAEAVAILKASPFADHLRIHAVVAGPGSDAPRKAFGSDEASWSGIASFGLTALPALQVQEVLKAQGIHSGVIAYAWNPETGVLFVPTSLAMAARGALKKAALGGAIRITW